eukprot:6491763-Amphidinium_carterae.2
MDGGDYDWSPQGGEEGREYQEPQIHERIVAARAGGKVSQVKQRGGGDRAAAHDPPNEGVICGADVKEKERERRVDRV